MATKKFQYSSSLFGGRINITPLPSGESASEQTIGGRPAGATGVRIKSIYVTARGYCNGTTYGNMPWGIALFEDIFSSTMAQAKAGFMISIPLAQGQSTVTNATSSVIAAAMTFDEGEGPVMVGTAPNISAVNLSGATTGFGVDGTINITYEYEWR